MPAFKVSVRSVTAEVCALESIMLSTWDLEAVGGDGQRSGPFCSEKLVFGLFCNGSAIDVSIADTSCADAFELKSRLVDLGQSVSIWTCNDSANGVFFVGRGVLIFPGAIMKKLAYYKSTYNFKITHLQAHVQ